MMTKPPSYQDPSPQEYTWAPPRLMSSGNNFGEWHETWHDGLAEFIQHAGIIGVVAAQRSPMRMSQFYGSVASLSIEIIDNILMVFNARETRDISMRWLHHGLIARPLPTEENIIVFLLYDPEQTNETLTKSILDRQLLLLQ